MVSKIIRVESEQLTLKHNLSHSHWHEIIFFSFLFLFYFHFCVFRLKRSLWRGFPLFPTMTPVSTLPSQGLTSPWPRSTSLRWIMLCLYTLLKWFYIRTPGLRSHVWPPLGLWGLSLTQALPQMQVSHDSWKESLKAYTCQEGWSIWGSEDVRCQPHFCLFIAILEDQENFFRMYDQNS